jgi:hypothetical protein
MKTAYLPLLSILLAATAVVALPAGKEVRTRPLPPWYSANGPLRQKNHINRLPGKKPTGVSWIKREESSDSSADGVSWVKREEESEEGSDGVIWTKRGGDVASGSLGPSDPTPSRLPVEPPV